MPYFNRTTTDIIKTDHIDAKMLNGIPMFITVTHGGVQVHFEHNVREFVAEMKKVLEYVDDSQ